MHHPVEVAVGNRRKAHWSRGELRTLRDVAKQHERGLEVARKLGLLDGSRS